MALNQPAEAYGGELAVEYNLYKSLAHGVTEYAQNAAVICMHQPKAHLAAFTSADLTAILVERPKERRFLRWSHQDLCTAAQNVALGLQDRGVHRVGAMVTLIPNGVEWAVLMYASVILGLSFVPLDSGMVTRARAEELANLMRLLSPDVVVVAGREGALAVNKSLPWSIVKPVSRVILDPTAQKYDDHTVLQWAPLASLVHNVDTSAAAAARLLSQASVTDPSQLALTYFTSGTSSGQPKGCPRTVAHVTSANEAQKGRLQFTPDSRFLLAGANFRVISSLALAVWAAGAAVVTPGTAFSPTSALDAIEQHHITHMVLVPALVHALVADRSFASRDTSSITHCFLGGDIITKDVYLKAARAFPDANVVVAHGMSEGGGIFAWPYFNVKPEEVPFLGEIAPVGSVEKGTTIRIVDEETNDISAREQPGEFYLSSPNVIDHYLGGIHEDSFYDDPEGSRWFKTGDLAVMNPNGVIYILGRVKDRIKRAGVPITPAAIESCLDKFTGSQTVVVGVPHPTLGHEPIAVVKSLGCKSGDEAKQHVVEVFGRDFTLGSVVTLQDLGLETFPLNATGKVMKTALQKNVVQYLDVSRKQILV